ncbi:MAG TPA: hypothetical protein VGL29_23010 [Blastocatellia bacterium]
MTSNELITLSIAILSLIVSGFAAYKAYTLGSYQLRLSNRIEYQKLLFEIDKQVMQDPSLSAMYDDHASLLDTNDPLNRAKLDAFISFHINLLEVVYVFFQNVRVLTGEEKEVSRAWDRWTKYLVENSFELRSALMRPEVDDFYNATFLLYVRQILKERKFM